MEELQQTQQTLEVSTGDLNELMKQNSAIAEDNSAVTQELAAGMQETRANTASIVESVRIMEQSSGNIHRLAADGAENSSQIQERAGEMERISTQSRNKTDEIFWWIYGRQCLRTVYVRYGHLSYLNMLLVLVRVPGRHL